MFLKCQSRTKVCLDLGAGVNGPKKKDTHQLHPTPLRLQPGLFGLLVVLGNVEVDGLPGLRYLDLVVLSASGETDTEEGTVAHQVVSGGAKEEGTRGDQGLKQWMTDDGTSEQSPTLIHFRW